MKKYCGILISVLLLLLTAGCGKDVPASTEPEYDYTSLVKPAIDITFEECLPPDAVSAVFGQPLSLTAVYADGTQGQYATEDGSIQLTVNWQKIEESAFQDLLTGLPGQQEPLTDLPFDAVWYDGKELFAYVGGYALEVYATVPGSYIPQQESVEIAKTIADNLDR